MRKFRALWVKTTAKWSIECPDPKCYDVIFAKRDEVLPIDRVNAHVFRRHPDWYREV